MRRICQAPKILKPGDKICVSSPAGRADAKNIEAARLKIEAAGFRAEVLPHATGSYHLFSGTDSERLMDLQQAFDDPGCRAILMSRGGYGLVRIIDRLDFAGFLRSPKWIIGFSDVTVLHARLMALGYQSVHGPMSAAFAESERGPAEMLLRVLTGERAPISAACVAEGRPGRTSGLLCGGNLAILASLCGSADMPDTRGKILLLEDTGEYLYRLDRMMYTLKRAGLLGGLAGLLVGGLTDMKDGDPGFGKTAETIIFEAVKEYDYPVGFGFPAGHHLHNLPVVLGSRAEAEVSPEAVTLRYL